MKLDGYKREILSSGGETTKFSAEMNGAAFAILSSGIYEYKIAAFVREILSNAYDSHKEAGKENIPIWVKLPNAWDQNLIIEDFGMGLDDEGVRTVFASYFKSTKNQTNDVIGGMGIGAKSIFSYSDTFTIVAVKDEIERTYSAFIGEEGIPQVQILSQHESLKENGVKIQIPIQSEDTSEVIEEFRVIASMFPVLPEVSGVNGEFEFIATDIHDQFAEKGYAHVDQFNHSELYSGGQYYASMGNVLYRIQEALVRQGDELFTRISVRGKVIIIPFDIGELTPAASRETLSLDEKTKNAVVEKVDKIAKEERDRVETEISKFESPISAYRWLYKEFSRFAGAFKWKNGTSFRSIQSRDVYLPYDSTASVIIERGSRLVKSPTNLWVRDIAECNNIFVFYADGAGISSADRGIRRLIDSGEIKERDMVIKIPENISDSLKNKVARYIGVPMTWESTKSLKERTAKERQYSGHGGITYDRGEKKDNTIYCKTVSKRGVRKIHHHEIDPHKTYVWCIDGEEHMATRFLEEDMIAVIKTPRAEKHVENMKLSHWKDELEKRAEHYAPYLAIDDLISESTDISRGRYRKLVEIGMYPTVAGFLEEVQLMSEYFSHKISMSDKEYIRRFCGASYDQQEFIQNVIQEFIKPKFDDLTGFCEKMGIQYSYLDILPEDTRKIRNILKLKEISESEGLTLE